MRIPNLKKDRLGTFEFISWWERETVQSAKVMVVGAGALGNEVLKNLALLDVYGRVAKALLGMAKEINGRLVIEDRPTQQDIANHIGASREMVARILKDLETLRAISRVYASISFTVTTADIGISH